MSDEKTTGTHEVHVRHSMDVHSPAWGAASGYRVHVAPEDEGVFTEGPLLVITIDAQGLRSVEVVAKVSGPRVPDITVRSVATVP